MTPARRNLHSLFLLTPAALVMALCGVVPMAFVAYYSLHDTFGGNSFIWVGTTWFRQILVSPDFHAALLRSLGFSLLVLAVEMPLGILVALKMPARGWLASAFIILFTIPLLTPTIVVGYLWAAMTLPKAGLLYELLSLLGLGLDMNHPVVVWLVLIAMDAWHWTGLVVLLCYAGLRAIPDDYYRAARIDGASAWAVFRHIQLPKLRIVLLVAVLLRFMDSFIIYTEPYVVARGGPGVSTTFLSRELVQTALVEFNLGEGGAMAVVYFLVVLCVSWAFFTLVVSKNSLDPKRAPL
ncbi:carbohydrate ABC transporter permease [Dongia sp.]|uniref:carbohydrate ABC transporter permease n=1 Tax=Dongia sp. TaxID=1977262 RepID=UPI0037503A04